ncbi:monocarboxylate transporter 12 [Planococcus citri]|uniref:monocarboxylate transporter 12 n=1 Tax=Planococcus citri TaxID=170843 RepID=UPI0031F901A0
MVELEKNSRNHAENKSAPSPQKSDSFEQPPPPDGGWGWVVVFASFMIHVVTDGVVYSFGEFLKGFLDQYHAGNGVTSLIISILVGTTLCSGPIASAFVNKFGCRPVTIAGSIISAFCVFISYWAKSVTVLIITIGFGTGIGFGLIYLPAIVSVTCYFEKYRSIATGIGVCGSGFGTIVFAPLVSVCIKHFGTDGTLIVISFMVLTCIFYGLLLRPVPYAQVEETPNNHQTLYSPENVPLTTVTLVDDVPNGGLKNGAMNGGRRYSIHDISSELAMDKDKLKTITSASQFVSQPTLIINDLKLNKSSLSLKSNHSGIMYKKDVFLTSSIRSIKDISKSNGYLSPVQRQRQISGCHQTTVEKKKYTCLPCSIECQDTIAEMTDFSLLKDLIFVLFALSNFLTSIGYNIPYVFIPIYIKTKGYEEEWSSYLLIFIGIGNTIGRIVLGYFSDKAFVNRLLVYNTCLTTCGIACILNIFSTGKLGYITFAVVYGFTTGAYVGLTSVITVDLFGLDNLTNAFGMLLLFQGVASFIGPPFAGMFCDYFDSYDPAFYITGVTIAFSGIMLYFIPSIERCLARRKQKTCDNKISC